MALLAATSPTPQASGAPAPAGAIVIVNSGSTNTAGYRIVVSPNGSAEVTINDQAAQTKTVSAATTKSLFADVKAAMPLDAITTQPCMRSVSFGTSTHVTYGGKQSPDLSCSVGDAAKKVGADVQKVESELDMSFVPRARGTIVRPSQPSPDPSS